MRLMECDYTAAAQRHLAARHGGANDCRHWDESAGADVSPINEYNAMTLEVRAMITKYRASMVGTLITQVRSIVVKFGTAANVKRFFPFGPMFIGQPSK